jgi:hypothetical protein
MCPATLAHHIVKRQLRDLEAWVNGPLRALATAGLWDATVTGMIEAPDLDTTAADAGRGPATRQRQIPAIPGSGHASAVTVDGWKPIVVRDARPTMPLAVKVVPIHAHEGLSRRAVVTQARPTLAGASRRHQVSCERGVVAGVARGWLAQQGLTCVVPATDHLAVTAEARASPVAAACTRGATGRGPPPGGNGGRPRWWASPG